MLTNLETKYMGAHLLQDDLPGVKPLEVGGRQVLIKKMTQFEKGVDHLVNSLALLPVLPLVWFLRFCN